MLTLLDATPARRRVPSRVSPSCRHQVPGADFAATRAAVSYAGTYVPRTTACSSTTSGAGWSNPAAQRAPRSGGVHSPVAPGGRLPDLGQPLAPPAPARHPCRPASWASTAATSGITPGSVGAGPDTGPTINPWCNSGAAGGRHRTAAPWTIEALWQHEADGRQVLAEPPGVDVARPPGQHGAEDSCCWTWTGPCVGDGGHQEPVRELASHPRYLPTRRTSEGVARAFQEIALPTSSGWRKAITRSGSVRRSSWAAATLTLRVTAGGLSCGADRGLCHRHAGRQYHRLRPEPGGRGGR